MSDARRFGTELVYEKDSLRVVRKSDQLILQEKASGELGEVCWKTLSKTGRHRGVAGLAGDRYYKSEWSEVEQWAGLFWDALLEARPELVESVTRDLDPDPTPEG